MFEHGVSETVEKNKIAREIFITVDMKVIVKRSIVWINNRIAKYRMAV
jgi:hypothetical protein